MPDPASPRDASRRVQSDEMFDLLARIDDLESALEILDEHGVATRDEVTARIAELEAEASRRDAAAGA